MKQPDDSLVQAAERLLAFEADGGERLGAEQGAAAAARIHEKLHRQLATVVGEAGFVALFARAVKLSTRSFPGLGEIGTLERLCELLKIQTQAQNAAIVSALVSNFVNLLSTFIGKGLTLKLLHNAWPEVLPTRTPPGRDHEE